MKTNLGVYLLKNNSKLMDELNMDAIKLAKKFAEYKMQDSDMANRVMVQDIILDYQDNRKKHARLQQEITDAIGLETMLPESTYGKRAWEK